MPGCVAHTACPVTGAPYTSRKRADLTIVNKTEIPEQRLTCRKSWITRTTAPEYTYFCVSVSGKSARSNGVNCGSDAESLGNWRALYSMHIDFAHLRDCRQPAYNSTSGQNYFNAGCQDQPRLDLESILRYPAPMSSFQAGHF